MPGSGELRRRTPAQSQTALWHTEQADIQFNRIARGLTPSRGLGLLEEARLFALLNLAVIDSSAAVFDAKYTYNFVRPVTAIRNGDADGNPPDRRGPGLVDLHHHAAAPGVSGCARRGPGCRGGGHEQAAREAPGLR